jgi:RNA polymerase sigma factor (sigma-70 family)
MFGSTPPVSGLSEPELIRLARRGHRDAFGELYDRHGTSVRRFTFSLTRNDSDADDLVQETFLALVQSKTEISVSGGAFTGYLCGIARNRFLEEIRRSERRRNLMQANESETESVRIPAPEQGLLAREISQRVTAALESLPPNQRSAVEDFDLYGYSLKEGAARAGIDPASFKARLNRGRQTLRKLLSWAGKEKDEINDELN